VVAVAVVTGLRGGRLAGLSRGHRPARELLLLLVAGALLPQVRPARAQQPTTAPSAPPPPATERIQATVAQARAEVQTLIGTDELIDGLYFGWFDRPYRRATIACLVKAVQVLDHEARLRRLGRSGLTDAQVNRLADWIRDAPGRATASARRIDFAPHRLCTDPQRLRAWTNRGATDLPPALVGFIDRATSSQHDRWAGDFDVLCCLGLRVIGTSRLPWMQGPDRQSLLDHGRALGITTMVPAIAGSAAPAAPPEAEPPETGSQRQPHVLRIIPVTLPELAAAAPGQTDERPGAILAITEPVRGESWSESLARQALYRAATGRQAAVVTGWAPPPTGWSTTRAPEHVALAMWIRALDGPTLMLMEGWRDLRDGSGSPHPSLLPAPAILETVAHTALDLLHFGPHLAAFHRPSPVAIVVGKDCCEADGDRWSPACRQVFEALAERAVRFDVLPELRLTTRAPRHRYDVVITPPDRALSAGTSQRLPLLLAEDGVRVSWEPDGAGLEPITVAVERCQAADRHHRHRLVVTGSGGRRPAGVFVFHGAGDRLALANTTAEPRRVWITTASGRPAPTVTDLLTGETLRRTDQGVDLLGRQVRVLVPEH